MAGNYPTVDMIFDDVTAATFAVRAGREAGLLTELFGHSDAEGSFLDIGIPAGTDDIKVKLIATAEWISPQIIVVAEAIGLVTLGVGERTAKLDRGAVTTFPNSGAVAGYSDITNDGVDG